MGSMGTTESGRLDRPGLIETVDSYQQADARRQFWAAAVVKAGLQDRYGVFVRSVRLSERHRAFGIFVDAHTA